MFRDYTLQTSGDRAMYALIGGTAVGAAIVTAFIAYVFIFAQDNLYLGLDTGFGENLVAGVIFFLVVFAYWVSGIVILGCPIWFVLHKLGLKTWIVSLIFGFFIPFLVSFWMAPESFSRAQNVSWATLESPVIFGLIGSLTALTIWRIAYRRPQPC